MIDWNCLPWTFFNWLITFIGEHHLELILNTSVLTILYAFEFVVVTQASTIIELLTNTSLRVVSISWIVTFTRSRYYREVTSLEER